MRRRIVVIFLFIIFVLTGCEQAKTIVAPLQSTEAQSGIERVANPQLAKLILKPERPPLDVSKDPFRPLLKGTQLTVIEDMGIYNIGDLRFVGVIRSSDEYLALLKSKSLRGVFRVHDRVRDYTIEDIQKDIVVLKNGDKTITLKRGAVN